MYLFRKLQMKSCPSIIGWYLTIQSVSQLFYFKEKSESGICEEAFKDAFKCNFGNKGHFKNTLSSTIEQIANMTNQSWIESLSDTLLNSMNSQVKLLHEGNIIYVNPTFIGYTFDKNNEKYNILQEVNFNKLMFPDTKEIRYLQWPNGIHWYAKIGQEDIYDKNGNMKWNTKKEAEKAVEEFLKGSI